MAELTLVESRFRFGENWAEFARGVNPDRIGQAKTDLARLLGRSDLRGVKFLDIGSGSGLHSLAALQMGAAQVAAVDIDEESVNTTRNVLARHAPNAPWTAELRSVFDLHPQDFGRFDIVYSWGVLHHTGAMFDAIGVAAALVEENGYLCIALYGSTALCGFWRWEKRIYSRAPKSIQRGLRNLYIIAYACAQTARCFLTGQHFSLRAHVRDYVKRRGMSFYIDVHDWLGGYPYESVSPDEARRFMATLGFVEQRSFIQPGARLGLFGAGCDEYVFRRTGS